MIAVTIYSRPGCHLCDEMKAVVTRVGRVVPFVLTEHDISADPEPLSRRLSPSAVVPALDRRLRVYLLHGRGDRLGNGDVVGRRARDVAHDRSRASMATSLTVIAPRRPGWTPLRAMVTANSAATPPPSSTLGDSCGRREVRSPRDRHGTTPPSTAREVAAVDQVVLERGDEDPRLGAHPLVILQPERIRDLIHPTVQIEVVSLRDVIAHNDIPVRPALSAAQSQVPAVVVERLDFDRHHEIGVADQALMQSGPGRRLAAAEHGQSSVWTANATAKPSVVMTPTSLPPCS